jgi:tRNA threonylcarbamoyladenosine biosynthesis protein TsaB
MKILAFDSTAKAASVAVCEDERCLALYTIDNGLTQSELLMPMTENILKCLHLSFDDIELACASMGPGSFTGVRIGVTTVKGFAQALDKPVVTADSLETLAYGLTTFDGLIVSALFARVDEVFCAAYNSANDGLETVIQPSVMTISELLEKLPHTKCLFVGDGAVLHKELIENTLGENAVFAGERQNIISAANMTLLCAKRAACGTTKKYDEISPLYLRVSQAEREYQEKEKGEKQ